MRGQSYRAWGLAFGLVVAPAAGMAADVNETPGEPLPDAFYISPSAGVMIFDFSDIEANVISIDGNSGGAIDISPDLDRVGPVLGGSFGARLGEFNGNTVRLRGSGFYSWYDTSDSVGLDAFGAMAWHGLSNGSATSSQAAAAAAALNPSDASAASAGNGAIQSTFGTSDPATPVAEAGAFNETGGIFVAAGNLGAYGLAIDYDEELAYWGGELALALESGAGERGVVFTPFIGAIVRGLDRDLETTLTDSELGVALSLREKLDGRYYGALIGLDAVIPMENGMAVDLSLSGAPLYLDADYKGHEANTVAGFTQTGPEITDSDSRLAGLLRAQAGLSFPIFGHSWLRIGGEVEYLTDAPSIERSIGPAAVAAVPAAAAAAAAAGGGGDLAALDFEDLIAYGVNASLVIPFGP